MLLNKMILSFKTISFQSMNTPMSGYSHIVDDNMSHQTQLVQCVQYRPLVCALGVFYVIILSFIFLCSPFVCMCVRVCEKPTILF